MPLILNGDTGISGVDGTAGTPSLQGTDSNTGVFYATDIVGIATNGTERMRIDSSGNVGIGTNSPNTTTANRIVLDINGTTSALYNISTGGTRRATFYSDSTDCVFGSITSIPLEFLTGGVERMRIGSNGEVLIATTASDSTAYKLQLGTGSADTRVQLRSNNAYNLALVNGTGTIGAWLGSAGGDIFQISRSDGSEHLRLNANANLVLKGGTTTASGVGVTFPATQSASSDANCLDDYEEGSFTPTIEGQASAGTYVYDTTNTFGRYQKIGNRVNFDLCVGISSVTSAGSGNLYVAGLPFTPQGFTNYCASCSVGYFVFVTTGWNGYYISCLTITGTSKLAIYYPGTSSSVAMPISVMGGVSYLYISGSYLT